MIDNMNKNKLYTYLVRPAYFNIHDIMIYDI